MSMSKSKSTSTSNAVLPPDGYPTRLQAYLVALELSEVLNHVPPAPGRKAALERFADDTWTLVERLDRFSVATSARGLGRLRQSLEVLAAQVSGLGLGGEALGMIEEKLAAIRGRLDVAEAEVKQPR